MPEPFSVYTPPRESPPPAADPAATPPAESEQGVLAILREWGDALVVAFVLAMFIRVFMLELFKIPTGSMTPTLIGGSVAMLDYNRDGLNDLVVIREIQRPLLFLHDGRRLVAQGEVHVSPADLRQWEAEGYIRQQHDRILVNKLAYWFRNPRRGEIAVFKVPRSIWTPDKPIYIKRVAGLPGERLTFDREGHLMKNGSVIEDPPFFKSHGYQTRLPDDPEFAQQKNITYRESGPGAVEIEQIRVPLGECFVLGDNTNSSRDSRYWGGVPLANLKGRAFFRYWPLGQMKFL
ncbi:MAG: Signal peptidase I V [candidate division BRC1 bacterium ADurb.BinA292]|nr:MAG: Signal peptidase I V [candidate division BRC1 bacterium ADurb.BinA292]